MPKPRKKPADYILPLNMNGLRGRMLRMAPPKNTKRETMFVYGHHASLERNFGVAEYINKYSGVTIPDLPGFGGMDSFYKIGEKPTLDNMADYLASFIKLRYRKGQKFSLVGLSLGFMVITRMLQKHPHLTKQIDILISFAGFTDKSDFKYPKRTSLTMRYSSSILSRRLPAAFIKYVLFRGPFIRAGYKVFEPIFVKSKNSKIRKIDEQERKRRIDFEVYLWQCNDVRTYMDMGVTMLTLNLQGQHIDLPVYHLAIKDDRYFDNLRVEEHMRGIYKDFHLIKAKVPAHSPSVIASSKDAEPYAKPFAYLLIKKK